MNEIWTPEDEAVRLGRRFTSLKQLTGMGQAKFAREHGVPGGPSIVNQHIKGHRPISMAAAIAYAKGFQCALSEISPRIALEVESASGVNSAASQGTDQPTAIALITPPPPPTPRQTLERLAYFIGESSTDARRHIGTALAMLAENPHNHHLLESILSFMSPEMPN